MKRFPTTRRSPNRLLVFARAPELGLVKTRLAADLGDDALALEIYEAMLSDLLESLSPPGEDLEIEILWTGSSAAGGELLERTFGSLPLSMQSGSGLGDRLIVAFADRVIFHAVDKIIAVGTDDPTLTRHDVENTFDLLDSCDWVAGPAVDGGYYLIGCRAASFSPSIFKDIAWGTGSVLEATIAKIRSRGATVAILPPRIDIDRLEDLRTLAARNALSGKLGQLVKTREELR